MKIRQYCDLITSYVDENDGALFWSETITRKKALGKRPTLIYTVVPKADDPNTEDHHLTSKINRSPKVHTVNTSDFSVVQSSSDEVILMPSETESHEMTARPGNGSGFLTTKHRWGSHQKARGAKLQFMLLSRFQSFWHGAPPTESKVDKKQDRLQKDVQQEIERVRGLMSGRDKYAREVTEPDFLRVFRGKPRKYLIYPDMGG